MDYKPLIEEAKKRRGMTEYAIGRAIGYKSASAIYQVIKGKKGMNGEKMLKLLELAGKTLAIIGLVTSTMLANTQDANAAKGEQARLSVYYVKFRIWVKRVFYSFASMSYAG